MKFEDFYKKHYLEIKTAESYLLDLIHVVLTEDGMNFEEELVEHITSRIKTPESTISKLKLKNIEPNEENALENLFDIIGVRLVVHFLGDIYTIRNLLVNSGKINIVKEKDYIREAKSTGYRGYHLIIETNLNGTMIRAELQLRTVAMDCWASLEHQIRYKKNIKHIDLVNTELKRCSDNLMSADISMEQIREIVEESEED